MIKNNKYSNKEKVQINSRHVSIFNKALDGIELMLDGILYDLKMYEGSYLEVPKTMISAMDFIISSLTKIQKGQRLALGLDNEIVAQDVEPKVNIIENVDIKKI